MNSPLFFRLAQLERFSIPAAIVMTFGIALLDERTGIHLRLYPLYFVPLAVVASCHSRRSTIVATLAGSAIWALTNYDPSRREIYIANVVSQTVAFLSVALLVNNQKLRADDHRKAASIDELTGLLNSRAFYAHAEVQLKRQRETPAPLTMAYLDVDNFKKVNSDLGHIGADQVLKDVATAMTRALRSSDVLGRIGGDEFALLLPGAPKERAAEVIERVRKSVSDATWGQGLPVTFSVGAVVFDGASDSVGTMMRLSDALMYRVKNGNKDGLLVLSASELN